MTALRGHHMFCATLFSGSGYDRDFTESMERLIRDMQDGGKFRLVRGHDDICARCPNRTAEGCALGTEDVARRDAAALEVTGLSPGDELDWDVLGKRLRQVSEEEFQHVCGDCRWQREGLCSYALLRERTAARP